MPSSAVDRIEANYDAPITVVIEQLKSDGITKKSAAERLGVAKNTLLRILRDNRIDWPTFTPELAEQRKRSLRARCLYKIEYKGKTVPLFDAAHEEGIPYKVVLERYKKGDRGRRLFRKVRKYKSSNGFYELELTPAEWRSACELAREVGTKKAAQSLGLPMGALTLALKGQLERLG